MKTLLGVIILLLSGCTAVTPTTAVAPTLPAAPRATAVVSAAEPLLLRTLVIQTEGQGESLLTHIEEARAERGEPLTRTFVEIQGETGQLWQGESLIYAGESLHFLQPLQSGGRVFLQVIAPAESEIPVRVLQTQTVETTDAPPPDVTVDFVRAEQASDGTWTFAVTLSHGDTGWDDYVDGWHVETADGAILGTRILLHPHVDEQPFTRSLSDVTLGEGVDEIFIRPHDLVSGYGVDPLRVPLAETGSGERYEVLRSDN